MAMTHPNPRLLENLPSHVCLYRQLPAAQLVEHCVRRKEGQLAANGAFAVNTDPYTGRSPEDRYIVDQPEVHHAIDWGKVNKPMAPELFERLWQQAIDYLHGLSEAFVFDGYAGADPDHRLAVRFITETAHHNLFVHQLFVRPKDYHPNAFTPDYEVLALPGLKFDEPALHSEAAVVLDLVNRRVLVAGTGYAGEIKKGMFSVMNFLMPSQDVLPMHCSANVGPDGDSALFFGLSGTGKTTLSADEHRVLIGDDEHGWGPNGVFNFEGGCYAKTIRLSHAQEPEIWDAIRFGALMENVVIDTESREPDYDDGSITENGRVGYPIEHIAKADPKGLAGHPKTVIFLTADAFGVLPPISKLSPEQAAEHFVSGYTSKVAGTERGIKEPQAVFSHCFGAPFMPRPARVYAELLKTRLAQHNTRVFLVNTGWQGGAYGVGHRMSLPHTRAMVEAALNGALDTVPTKTHPVFVLEVPTQCPGVPAEILDPRSQWADGNAYDAQARQLVELFAENARKH